MSTYTPEQALSPVAAAVGLGSTLVLLFIFCLIVRAIAPGLQASHAWIALFTVAPMNSARAWIEGILASLVFGAAAGAIFAFAYNRARKSGV